MTNDRTIFITGVTGNQCHAVAQALQGSGFHLRGRASKESSSAREINESLRSPFVGGK
jgi:hypothetical protein